MEWITAETVAMKSRRATSHECGDAKTIHLYAYHSLGDVMRSQIVQEVTIIQNTFPVSNALRLSLSPIRHSA